MTITDQYGNPVAGVSVTFAASGDGSVTGSPATTNASGVATLGSWTLATTVGPNTLTATAGALSTTFSATGTAGAPVGANSTLGTSAASLPADGTSTATLTVQLKDQFGNDLTAGGATVALSTTAGSVSAVTDNGNGTYTATLTAGNAVATATVSGTVNGSALGNTVTVEFTAGPPANLVKHAGDAQSAAVNTAVSTAPAVRVTDANGIPVPNVTVTFAVAAGGGSITGPTQTTGSDGIATVGSWTLGTTAGAGSDQLQASVAGLGSVTFTANATAGAATQLAVATQPSDTVQSGIAFPQQPTVQLRDQYGNAVTQAGVAVTADIASGGGALGGNATVSTNGSGQAVFTDLAITGTVGDRTLGFSSGGLTGATSNPVSVVAGTPTQLIIATQPSTTAQSGTPFPQQPVVQLRDAAGNPVAQAGVTVTAAIASGGGTLGGTPTATTDASGAATFTNLSISGTAGDRTLSFSATGLTGATSGTVTLEAGPPAQLAVATQPSSSAQAGIAFAQQPAVQLQDVAGNPVGQSGVTVTAEVLAGSGSLGGTLTATTDASGVATFTNLFIGGTAGGYTLRFTAPLLTPVNSHAMALSAGTPAALAFAVQPSTTVASAPITPAVQVSVVDAYGNVVPNATDDVTVAIGTNPSGGTLSGTTTVAATGGVATFSNLSVNLVGTGYDLTASSGSLTGATSGPFNVTHGPLDHFLVEAAGGGPIGSQLAGTPFNVRVTAQDAYNNTVTSFTGTVGFTSTPSGGISAGATSGAFTAGVLSSHGVTFGTPGSFTLTATRTAGTESGTSNSFDVQAPPTAVNEGPAANSSPGQPYHAFYNTSGSPQTFSLSAPGVLSNDNLGFPTATITSFGADSLGGSVTTYAAGSTVSPLPGTGRTTGSLRVDADGTATFTPPDGFTGNYVFRYRLTNARGTSDARVTIAVGARPAAVNDTYSPELVGNVPINTATSTQFRVTANDQGDAKTLAITGQTGGTATLNPDSTFTFRPTPGYEGAASFTYTVTNGFGTSAAATVSMTVGTPIWFINAGAGAGGDGRYDAPFNSLASLAAINNGSGNNPAASDRIFLYTGTYTGPLTLLSGQRLIGQGATASLSSIAGVTWPADAGSEPAMNGTAPTLTASNATALTLANVGSASTANNTLRGFNIGNVGATGTALAGTSFGTLDVSEVGINTNGRALNLATGTLGGSFPVLRSTGGTNNVLLSSVGTGGTNRALGTAADALSGATDDALKIDGGNGSFTYAGTITNTATLAVNVINKNGGTVTLSGSINPAAAGRGISLGNNSNTTLSFTGAAQKISMGTGAGVSLSGNNGSTISFTGGALEVATTTGNGVTVNSGVAPSGGTLIVTGANNTITSAGGVALNVANTTIGAGGLNFRSISANGGSNGIVLNNTGSTAGLTVTGTGSAGSGGTIQNMNGNGVHLVGTRNTTLQYMIITANAANGVFGDELTNFTLLDGSVTNNDANHPTGTNESGLFFNRLYGTNTVRGSTISGTNGDHVRWETATGAQGTLRVVKSTLGPNPVGTGANGFAIVATGDASITAVMDSSTVSGNQTSGFLTSFANTATYNVTVRQTQFTGNNIGIDHGIGGGNGTFTFTNNTLLNHRSNAINIISDATSTGTTKANGTVSNNVVGDGTGQTGSDTGNGIGIDIRGGASVAMTVQSNLVRNTELRPILMTTRLGNGRADFTVLGNTAGPSVDPFGGSYEGIYVVSDDSRTVCLNMSGNTATGLNQSAYRVRQTTSATFQLQGFSGDGTSSAAVSGFIAGQNTGTAAVQTSGTGTRVAYTGGTCSTGAF
ncbi:MAG TPA: invasin domain 3-containing protein [Longimicrobiaceae bacterium]|nr:invasin domain 3-containing protein [Longimicrobiaceae bacterium]